MPDWFENDELFLEQLRVGHAQAELVAEALRSEGLVVAVTPMEVRADITDRTRFVDEHDLLVGQRAPCRIDVKSRELRFTTPADYPCDTAFVDTVLGWEAKVHRPMAIVLVSQPTGGMAVVSIRAADRWRQEERFDHKRKIRDVFYMVAREELRSVEDLVAWLRQRETAP